MQKCSMKLDVFSIGVVIFNLLFGKIMIDGETLQEIMDKNLNFTPE